MATCRVCGQSIDIRWVGGALVPIHPNGWCPGASGGGGGGRSSSLGGRGFRTVESYINPNAYCPVCGEQVFFYQSPFGGRVFFDALGWPWPKHPCTDKKPAQTGAVRRPKTTSGRGITLRDKSGAQLDVYELDEMEREDRGWDMKFRRISNRSVFRVHLSDAKMRGNKLTEDDFRDAPSFVVPPSVKHSPTRRIEFICERLKRIVTIELPKI